MTHLSGKGLIFSIYNEHIQLNTQPPKKKKEKEKKRKKNPKQSD